MEAMAAKRIREFGQLTLVMLGLEISAFFLASTGNSIGPMLTSILTMASLYVTLADILILVSYRRIQGHMPWKAVMGVQIAFFLLPLIVVVPRFFS